LRQARFLPQKALLAVVANGFHFALEGQPDRAIPTICFKSFAIRIKTLSQCAVALRGMYGERCGVKQVALTNNFPAACTFTLMQDAASYVFVELAAVRFESCQSHVVLLFKEPLRSNNYFLMPPVKSMSFGCRDETRFASMTTGLCHSRFFIS
jgi:hypothetical protein